MDIADHNRKAWNGYVASGNKWTKPFSPAQIENARAGDLSDVVLTPNKSIPMEWYGDGGVRGKQLLCLAGGGGQQGPMFAAAGAHVTVYDMSDGQLGQDRFVAEREGLEITTVQGDMRDLGVFEDASFDLIFHPCSNGFVPEILSVWKEAYRVLRSGGALLSGFVNPAIFTYDEDDADKPEAMLRHKVPYSDLEVLSKEELEARAAKGRALEFGHSLQDQIGGQTAAGFLIADFFADGWSPEAGERDRWFEPFFATRALKLDL
ncbi:MAG: class I SAM-dependent methyltransferase [Myxococcota bacterium]|jgi:SAM-dependent methyltransferase|nr:class I SAM-dependent methyltransferase [Myxococcota bacterium]